MTLRYSCAPLLVLLQVAIIFFIFGGSLLYSMLSGIKQLVADVQKADADGDGDVTTDEFKAAFGENSLEDKSFVQMMMSCKLGLTTADSYLFSRRFMADNKLDPKTFNPIVYLEAVGASVSS